MAKKEKQPAPKTAGPARGERMPPPLAEDLIAKLQAAVAAAQRKRARQHDAEAEPEQDE